ncbi:ABC transporter ATP-binding protein [Bacillus sp. RAR_GA_16]|uniref:ABC transporter ATP-binding protein n=1 Tax=Bacillus sp. RAR_GA_16 TaxID=2876774 RepID=UPI001CCB68BD|nr:ABC transporter ATP-binding protein [Bacillus sp. RAR_GA_16]MCA0172937.1 ABC transporter ATP-binding protein [Bacillus sp. RAR_GA_16]
MSIEMHQLSKKFNNQEFALSDVDFTLRKGEVVGLVGPNGAGKTTLMKIISGIIVQYDGQFTVQGEGRSVGSLIEKPKFFPNKSGRYNINYFHSLFGGDDQHFDEIIESLGMKTYLKKKVKNYSLGMKQRLGIALALISNPDYLVLDEPTNGMDPDGIRHILGYLKRLAKKQGIGILISSHILEDIESMSDRVYVIKEGRIINEYAGDQHDREVVELTFSENDLHQALHVLEAYEGVTRSGQILSVPFAGDMKQVLKHLSQNDLFPVDVKRKKDTLEDFYFQNMESEAK